MEDGVFETTRPPIPFNQQKKNVLPSTLTESFLHIANNEMTTIDRLLDQGGHCAILGIWYVYKTARVDRDVIGRTQSVNEPCDSRVLRCLPLDYLVHVYQKEPRHFMRWQYLIADENNAQCDLAVGVNLGIVS